MEDDAIGTVAANTDFTLTHLIMSADPVVKLVLIVLAIASIWSWVVIGDKLFSLGGIRKKAEAFERAFWSGRTDDFEMRPGEAPTDAASRVFMSASREWAESRRPGGDAASLVNRAERSMRATVDREVSKASKGLGVLATIGSSSPFIGLFGTVWGIMNAFMSIGVKGDVSFGAVAGPIAEALFATGLGLIAAIPAVIFYNKFTGDVTRLADQLDSFSQDVLVRLSRRASDSGGSS